MDYSRQVDILVDYIKNGEKKTDDFKIGMEMEHLVLNKDTYQAISYYGKEGIEGVLLELVEVGWQPVYEGKYILKLVKKDSVITLEPGAQLEISISPFSSLKKIKDVYFPFLDDLIPILNRKAMILVAIGYQPVSSISEIPLLPKKRYKYMFEYLGQRGKYAHHMMKGTASLQVNLDYKDERDYIKKIRVAYFLSSFIYMFFDNGPFFEKRIFKGGSVRSLIWENCDNDRCGLIKGIFDENLSYNTYAEYVLNTPAIITKKGEDLFYTGNKLNKDIFNPDQYTEDEVSHMFSMVFPDIRTKKFIEIRMSDSLPYPYNFGYLSMIKGLLYNQENLDNLFKISLQFDELSYLSTKSNIKKFGLATIFRNKPIIDFFLNEVLMPAKKGLAEEERDYINCLIYLFNTEFPLKQYFINNYCSYKSLDLEYCTLEGTLNVGECI